MSSPAKLRSSHAECASGPSCRTAAARGYICENFGALLPAARPGTDRLQRPGRTRAISSTPVAAYVESRRAASSSSAKFMGGLWSRRDRTIAPLDVVAWHGNYAPYKYDLRRFNTIGSISFDHPDPSIFTRAALAVRHAGHRTASTSSIFPPRMLAMQDTVPSALVPPQRRRASSWA